MGIMHLALGQWERKESSRTCSKNACPANKFDDPLGNGAKIILQFKCHWSIQIFLSLAHSLSSKKSVFAKMQAQFQSHQRVILGDKMNLRLKLGKLFYESSTGVPALLPCSQLPRQARGTLRKLFT